jgi:hypothetical protein
MRSPRSISLPLSFAITCAVWFAFLWTMQHAPVSRRAGSGEDLGGARSSGGLANNFATAVVKFFDDQDPREMDEGASPVEPVFDSEMVEYLPLPKLDRKELAKDLPEVFANLSLTPRNLFRSNVDLDGDRDLDLALLVRISKTEALGAVLEYVGDEKFRFAGKFTCMYERAEDFPKCFVVVLTGAGRMHVLSHTTELEAGKAGVTAEDNGTDEVRPGWRRYRLEGGSLKDYGSIEDWACRGARLALDAEPVPETSEDLFRLTGNCNDRPICQVFRFAGSGQGYQAVDTPGSGMCPETPGEAAAARAR